MNIVEEKWRKSEKLALLLKSAKSDREKISVLEQLPDVQRFLKNDHTVKFLLEKIDASLKAIAFQIIAVGEGGVVFNGIDEIKDSKKAFDKILSGLKPAEKFYDTIGGITGYYLQVLKLILGKENQNILNEGNILQPAGIDLRNKNDEVRKAVRWGVESLGEIAEIYPVGGAGDRLGLQDPATLEDLPAAVLPFEGKTLLEGLVRDLQAREYLYYKLFGRQLNTPVALMTSEEKDNHRHILDVCEKNNWFGRPKESFFLFKQPLVPVITEEGHFSLSKPFELNLKPGGHGVIWKLAKDQGVFDWLRFQKRCKASVRQINNPVAGTDYGLLALFGIGCHENKSIGFASCPRLLDTAQGMNVLIETKKEKGYAYKITNIEYTEFERLKIKDEPATPGSPYSQFPANTNILFIDIDEIEKAAEKNPIPGMIINMKSKFPSRDERGLVKEKIAGRLESTMQNIADMIVDFRSDRIKDANNLSSFITFNEQRKTISVAKKSYQKGKSIIETPEGCFYERLQNHHELLKKHCGMHIPELCDPETYLKEGPNFHILMHPALGPLYSIIGQKIRGGSLRPFSEMHLEIAELDMENTSITGSLLITALDPLGQEGSQSYSEYCGKCRLKNVRVENRGIDRSKTNGYWKDQIKRHEALKIVLHGNAEFVAENVSFDKDRLIEVAAGTRTVAYEQEGQLRFYEEKITRPTWEWAYAFDVHSEVRLSRQPSN